MNWDEIKGNWLQFKGKAQEQWGELTEDDVSEVKGQREQLIGKIQAKYGKTREAAEQEVAEWEKKLHDAV